jgi:hypothetical protein
MYNDRPIFWPVFWAVFAALVAFNVLKWGWLRCWRRAWSWDLAAASISTRRHPGICRRVPAHSPIRVCIRSRLPPQDGLARAKQYGTETVARVSTESWLIV